MGHQSPHYLKLKGKTYYFSRRVPKELQKHSKYSRFEICLRTSDKSVAIKQALFLAQELEDQWSILRRRARNDRIGRIFGSEVVSSSASNSAVGRGPKLTEGLEVYLRLKGVGRPDTFEAKVRRMHALPASVGIGLHQALRSVLAVNALGRQRIRPVTARAMIGRARDQLPGRLPMCLSPCPGHFDSRLKTIPVPVLQ